MKGDPDDKGHFIVATLGARYREKLHCYFSGFRYSFRFSEQCSTVLTSNMFSFNSEFFLQTK